MQALSIASVNGGVGKTTIAINLAAYLAKSGYKVCIIDLNMFEPSMNSIFHNYLPTNGVSFINTFLETKSNDLNFLINFKEDLQVESDFWVGFANPDPAEISKFSRLNKKEALDMLYGLFRLKEELKKDPYNIDFLIFEPPASVSSISINSFAASELNLFVINPSEEEIDTAKTVFASISRELKQNFSILVNNVPLYEIDDLDLDSVTQKIKEKVNLLLKGTSASLLGILPQDKFLQVSQLFKNLKLNRSPINLDKIHVLDMPDSPFSKSFAKFVNQFLIEDSK